MAQHQLVGGHGQQISGQQDAAHGDLPVVGAPVHIDPDGLLFIGAGEGDLVVMDIETYNRREKMLKLREELLAVEEDRIAGRNGCTLDELDAYLDDAIAEE